MNPNKVIEIIYSNNNNTSKAWEENELGKIFSFLFSSLRFFLRFTEIGP